MITQKKQLHERAAAASKMQLAAADLLFEVRRRDVPPIKGKGELIDQVKQLYKESYKLAKRTERDLAEN